MESYGISWNQLESAGIIWNHMESAGIIWKYGIIWNHKGHLKPFRAIGSLRNELAASISSSFSPARPSPAGLPRAILGKSDFQLDYKIAHKSAFEPIAGLRHYSSWIRISFLCRLMSSFRLDKVGFMTIFVVQRFRIFLLGPILCCTSILSFGTMVLTLTHVPEH